MVAVAGSIEMVAFPESNWSPRSSFAAITRRRYGAEVSSARTSCNIWVNSRCGNAPGGARGSAAPEHRAVAGEEVAGEDAGDWRVARPSVAHRIVRGAIRGPGQVHADPLDPAAAPGEEQHRGRRGIEREIGRAH